MARPPMMLTNAHYTRCFLLSKTAISQRSIVAAIIARILVEAEQVSAQRRS